MTNTYWNENGKYQDLVPKLQALIPIMGEVENARKNPALERFRVASNCYYDLYNNGLGNRCRQFAKLFKIRTSDYRYRQYDYTQGLYELTETKMDEFIQAAAIEQNLVA